jgi:nucleotide-binding universal stress UspA family protein
MSRIICGRIAPLEHSHNPKGVPMTALATPTSSPALTPVDRPVEKLTPRAASPIIAAVDDSAASMAAVDAAVRLGAEVGAPLVFVYVRRGPVGLFGAPIYQRRLTSAMARARAVLGRALSTAARADVTAEAEILEGMPHKRILELARDRGAQLVVVGRRRRKIGRSVSHAVVRTARRPVIVAQGLTRSLAERAA